MAYDKLTTLAGLHDFLISCVEDGGEWDSEAYEVAADTVGNAIEEVERLRGSVAELFRSNSDLRTRLVADALEYGRALEGEDELVSWLELQRDEAPLLSTRQRTINDVLGHLGRNGLVVIMAKEDIENGK